MVVWDHEKGKLVTNFTYSKDLPDDLELGNVVAIDCETMGLNPGRDRLCVVQLSSGDGHTHIVQIEKDQKKAQNLTRLLQNEYILKLFLSPELVIKFLLW